MTTVMGYLHSKHFWSFFLNSIVAVMCVFVQNWLALVILVNLIISDFNLHLLELQKDLYKQIADKAADKDNPRIT